MAKAGRLTISVQHSKVTQNLNLALQRVQRGTRKATLAALADLKQRTLAEVPEETHTLAQSLYEEIEGNSREGFRGTIGYGGNGNPKNPLTGQRASEYMVAVHEDLDAHHAKGKAKFLEDPVKAYRESFGPRVAAIVRSELEGG